MEKESKKSKKSHVKERLGRKRMKRKKDEALGRSGVTAGKAPYRAAEQCGMIGWWVGIVQ